MLDNVKFSQLHHPKGDSLRKNLMWKYALWVSEHNEAPRQIHHLLHNSARKKVSPQEQNVSAKRCVLKFFFQEVCPIILPFCALFFPCHFKIILS